MNTKLLYVLMIILISLASLELYQQDKTEAKLKAQIFTQETKIMNMQAYIDSQKVKIKWVNFLELMLDKDQEVRMDVVEDYVVVEGLLYKPIGGINDKGFVPRNSTVHKQTGQKD